MRKTMSDIPDFVERYFRMLRQTKTNEDFFNTMTEESRKTPVSNK
jgi:transcription termination factor Rho